MRQPPTKGKTAIRSSGAFDKQGALERRNDKPEKQVAFTYWHGGTAQRKKKYIFEERKGKSEGTKNIVLGKAQLGKGE